MQSLKQAISNFSQGTHNHRESASFDFKPVVILRHLFTAMTELKHVHERIVQIEQQPVLAKSDQYQVSPQDSLPLLKWAPSIVNHLREIVSRLGSSYQLGTQVEKWTWINSSRMNLFNVLPNEASSRKNLASWTSTRKRQPLTIRFWWGSLSSICYGDKAGAVDGSESAQSRTVSGGDRRPELVEYTEVGDCGSHSHTDFARHGS